MAYATVTLSDIYDATPFEQAVQEAAAEQNNFLQAGVIQDNPMLNEMAAAGGFIGEIPFFLGLDNTIEPNYSSDVQATDSEPNKITDGKQIYRKAMKNQSWSIMDLARELSIRNGDPLGAIANRIGKYWATDTQNRILSSSTGILLDDLSDGGLMTTAIHSETAAGASATTRIHADAVIDAAATLGDLAGDVTMIAMHSVQYTQLQKLNLIAYIPDARGEVSIPTYLGYRVIVDDAMPSRAGTTDGVVYTVMLFAAGAFGYGTAQPVNASAVDRNEAAGNGGGEEVIYSRVTEIIHPTGFEFLSASVAGQSATHAELEAAANWNRVYATRKNVKMAFLTCN